LCRARFSYPIKNRVQRVSSRIFGGGIFGKGKGIFRQICGESFDYSRGRIWRIEFLGIGGSHRPPGWTGHRYRHCCDLRALTCNSGEVCLIKPCKTGMKLDLACRNELALIQKGVVLILVGAAVERRHSFRACLVWIDIEIGGISAIDAVTVVLILLESGLAPVISDRKEIAVAFPNADGSKCPTFVWKDLGLASFMSVAVAAVTRQRALQAR
jgi:hypothetical protein